MFNMFYYFIMYTLFLMFLYVMSPKAYGTEWYIISVVNGISVKDGVLHPVVVEKDKDNNKRLSLYNTNKTVYECDYNHDKYTIYYSTELKGCK